MARRRPPFRPAAALGIAALAALAAAGCGEAHFYGQAVRGHLDLLGRKRPIAEALADPATPEPLKRKLALIGEVRAFAGERLGMSAARGYTSFADLGRPWVTRIVKAAPPFELRAHEWCYLIVGCMGYRGYFDEADAEALAAELRAEGLDVSVGGARAYSTGPWLNNGWVPEWFHDPVLNTFTDRGEATIIRTLVHELAHQVLLVDGDTTFNESFATFVEQEGFLQFLRERRGGDLSLWERHRAEEADRERFQAVVDRGVAALKAVYASGLDEGAMLAAKRAAFEAMRRDYEARRAEFTTLDYDSWFGRGPNNADLIGLRQYTLRVAAFGEIHRRADGDWGRFFAEAAALAELPRAERDRALESLDAASAAPAAGGTANAAAAPNAPGSAPASSAPGPATNPPP